MQSDTIVIGAGIIGINCALALQSRGFNVCVLNRKGVAAETSQGNAGAFAYTDIEPLATPGIMRKAPKWLLDPLGPLSISPAYTLKIAPWMLRFWRASWPDRYDAAEPPRVCRRLQLLRDWSHVDPGRFSSLPDSLPVIGRSQRATNFCMRLVMAIWA